MTKDAEQDAFLTMSEDEEKDFAAQNDEEASAEPETQENLAEPETQEKKKPTTVPHQALHEERERRKQSDDRARALEQQIAADRARFEERFRIVQEMQRQPAQQAPDPEQDPLGAIKYERDQRVAMQREMQRRAYQEQQQRAQQEAYARQQQETDSVIQSATQEWETAKAERPDLQEAYDYARESLRQEFEFLGWQPGQPLERALIHHELGLINDARRRNIPIAEYVENFAKRRGYGGPKPRVDEAEERVTRTATAQSRSRSLSQAGGSAAGTEMTAEQWHNMPLDEFEAWAIKNPAKAKKLLGA
jgi:hypothetical protein